jgi:hypothetical protein
MGVKRLYWQWWCNSLTELMKTPNTLQILLSGQTGGDKVTGQKRNSFELLKNAFNF